MRGNPYQWFFSFVAAFSAHRDTDERLVVLLDEPVSSLHGETQGDFLRRVHGELESGSRHSTPATPST
ncbi:hypothetical protein [Streptomyces sp. enrichment culture]|uniref:hypothetical protein n=1 Tax=Streptomyces sp. enrichment culture TaxID=1795815 RepID=UPI003F54493F